MTTSWPIPAGSPSSARERGAGRTTTSSVVASSHGARRSHSARSASVSRSRLCIADWSHPEGPYSAWRVFGPNMTMRASLCRARWAFDPSIGPDGTDDYIPGSEIGPDGPPRTGRIPRCLPSAGAGLPPRSAPSSSSSNGCTGERSERGARISDGEEGPKARGYGLFQSHWVLEKALERGVLRALLVVEH